MSYKINTFKINFNYLIKSVTNSFDSRPKALYYGWLGHKNLGDEALYFCVNELLKSRISFVTNGELDRLYLKSRAVSKIDLLVLGGGTLINRNDYVIDNMLEYRKNFKQCIVFGTGVANEDFWQQMEKRTDRSDDWREFLNSCSFVGVRGPFSLQYMKKLGIDKAAAIGDPVLYLGQETIMPKARRKRVGFNFGRTNNKLWGGSDKRVDSEMCHLIRIFLENNWELSFYNVYDKDTEHFQRFVDTYKLQGKISFVDASDCPISMALSYFKDIDIFIGEKLHASILAACSYTPFIMLEYRPKCLDFMASIGYEKYNFRVDSFSAQETYAAAEELYENCAQIQTYLKEKVLYYKSKLIDSANNLEVGC